jgi:hypothetical protein
VASQTVIHSVPQSKPRKLSSDNPGFRDHLRIIRESQKRFEKPVQAEPKPKSTVMEWIRNGFRFPRKGRP